MNQIITLIPITLMYRYLRRLRIINSLNIITLDFVSKLQFCINVTKMYSLYYLNYNKFFSVEIKNIQLRCAWLPYHIYVKIIEIKKNECCCQTQNWKYTSIKKNSVKNKRCGLNQII